MVKTNNMPYLETIIRALEQLGGTAHLDDIYKKMVEIGFNTANANWKRNANLEITSHSHDASSRERDNKPHIFERPKDSPKGVWALASNAKSLATHFNKETIFTDASPNMPQAVEVIQSNIRQVTSSRDSKIDNYTLAHITSDGCFLPLTTLERMFARLCEKKNIILQGPPGTGKTWLAKRLAWALAGEKSSPRVQALQFHATLSYEDFVCGWRPVGDGKLELLDGPFLEALAMANKDPETPYVLVIEEINRGNPAQIFGELLTLLEADKRKPEEALRLCYQNSGGAECRTVHLPANLYLIGTMNIADRSLAIVDFALRRRFAFFDLTPHFGEDWQRWMCDRASLPPNFVAALGEAMQDCNNVIANDHSLGPQYAIGHSFVTCDTPVQAPRAWIEEIVAAEIAPLLKEYWFNDLKKAEDTAQAILDACHESLVRQ